MPLDCHPTNFCHENVMAIFPHSKSWDVAMHSLPNSRKSALKYLNYKDNSHALQLLFSFYGMKEKNWSVFSV